MAGGRVGQAVDALLDVLVYLYPLPEDQRRIAETAGIPPAFLPMAGTAVNTWHGILKEAEKRGKLHALVTVASGEYPENEWLQAARQGRLLTSKAPDIAQDVDWRGPDDEDELEKIIGQESTLLPISFLEVGLLCASSVARVRVPGGGGSGFLTDGNLLITNHHVVPDEEVAGRAVVQFNYQQTAAGIDAPFEEVALDPAAGFATSARDDWTAVRLEGDPSTRWGTLPLEDARAKKNDRVNIIQHPGGGPKQIALYHNVVVFAGEDRIQYLTDTLPGSSGSPVFDHSWRVVALHHSGGWLTEPGSKRTYYRNEGIPVGVILRGLRAAGLAEARPSDG